MFNEGRSFSGNERDKLFLNRGDGTFVDVSDLSGCDSPNDGRGVITADLDDDGDLDMFVHENQRERHAMYRNELGGSFLKVRLRGTTGQYEAIGATVVVATAHGPVAQVLTRGAGFVSCQAPELVFGMGGVDEAAVTVHWPGGATESFGTIAKDSRVLLVEGHGKSTSFDTVARTLPDPLPRGLRIRIGETVPTFVARDIDGQRVHVDVRALGEGKRVYLNFWATFCSSCLAEMGDLTHVHQQDPDIRVVGVAMDAPGTTDTKDAEVLALIARRFDKSGGKFPTFAHVPDAPTDDFTIESIVDLERLPIPTTLVLSPEGVVIDIIRGPIQVD